MNLTGTKRIVNALLHRSPFENWITLKRKLRGFRSDHAAFDLESVLRSVKHFDPCKLLDRLGRYQTVLRNSGEWVDLEFSGKNVLEIGSGPLLGWAPIACFLGCAHYVCVELHFDSTVVESQVIRDRYFVPLYRQLRAIFGPHMSFSEFERALSESVSCHTTTLEHVALAPDSFDVVISNSVLEHVHVEQLAVFFERLRTVTRLGGRHLHCIDFGNHSSSIDPFEGLYSAPADKVRSRFPVLNVVKPSEFLRLFIQVGFEGRFVPYLRVEPDETDLIASEWHRFRHDDLLTAVGFLVGQRVC